MSQIPRRLHLNVKHMRDSMLDAGYVAADALAVLRAMFGPPSPETILAAWHVFDPAGRARPSSNSQTEAPHQAPHTHQATHQAPPHERADPSSS